MLEEISKHTKLVIAVGTATALGTLAVCRLVQHRTSPRKKRVVGAGPTGKGKWKLYHAHSFMSARCVWLLEEMKVTDDFGIIEHNPHTASLEEKYQYKKTVHPHGTIPAIVTSEGTLMTESAAICLYLTQIYGPYLPDERNEPTYYNWSIYSSTTADNCIRIVYRQLYTINEKDSESKLLETNVTKCLEWVNCLESLLAQDNREYICTNGFTAADVIVAYSVFWLSLINEGALIKHAPNVQQYLHRIKRRPLWSKCMDGPNGTDPDWVAITRKTTRK